MDPNTVSINCGCCSSKTSLTTGFIVQITLKARWSYPVWGNLSDGTKNNCVGVICDACGKKHIPLTSIKNVIEFNGNAVCYHAIVWAVKNGVTAANYNFNIT
jgi:hypothetical protein